MTDNEIIKALEYCKDCSANLNVEIIDLITRQRAEIERLNKVYQANQQLINALNKSYFLAKAEAYKEFADRLKETFPNNSHWIKPREKVDNLLKEMVGDDNAEEKE